MSEARDKPSAIQLKDGWTHIVTFHQGIDLSSDDDASHQANVASLRSDIAESSIHFQVDMDAAAAVVRQCAEDLARAGNDFRRIGQDLQSVGAALNEVVSHAVRPVSS